MLGLPGLDSLEYREDAHSIKCPRLYPLIIMFSYAPEMKLTGKITSLYYDFEKSMQYS